MEGLLIVPLGGWKRSTAEAPTPLTGAGVADTC